MLISPRITAIVLPSLFMSAALTSLLARTSSTVSVPTSLSAGSTGLSSVYTSLQEAESFTEKEEGIEISVLTVTSKPSLSLFATVTVAGIFMLTAPEVKSCGLARVGLFGFAGKLQFYGFVACVDGCFKSESAVLAA